MSCEKEVDLGYPPKISFTKDGGEKTVFGDQPFVFAVIQDYDGNEGSIEKGEDAKLCNVYDWLKVEYSELYNDSLKVYAAPNTTARRRTLYIQLYSGREYQVVKVTQR